MERTILHSDLNNFYASVECNRHPEIREKAVIVCGDHENRHGIVLAKNYIAKSFGIKTGDVIWEAKQKCPDIVEVKADFKEYLAISKKVRQIYNKFTDQIESFGIDECWLDVTGSVKLFGDGFTIAESIRKTIKEQLGITVSIGVSFNKIFAKLGSEIKKPDAVTVISKKNFKDIVWRLPVEELLYVGKKTKAKLNKYNIWTIGELALTDINFLKEKLNKWGEYLYNFANGFDNTPVFKIDALEAIKSIGNSLTNYRDLNNNDEVKAMIYLLSESVAARLREYGSSRASVVHVYAKDSILEGYSKQRKMPYPTRLSKEIAETAFKLFKEIYPWKNKVRAVGISISGFTGPYEQIAMAYDDETYKKAEALEETVDIIRDKYGNKIIQRGIVATDKKLKEADIKGDHTIHPESFFHP